MRKRPQGSSKPLHPVSGQNPTLKAEPNADLSVEDLARRIPEFLYDCEHRGHSSTTLTEERSVLEKFLRYLRENNASSCGGLEIHQYLTMVTQGGMQRNGRWGQQEKPSPVRPLNLSRFSYQVDRGN